MFLEVNSFRGDLVNINSAKRKLGEALIAVRNDTGLSVRGFSTKTHVTRKMVLALQEGQGYREAEFVNRIFKYLPDVNPELKSRVEGHLSEIERYSTAPHQRMGPIMRSATLA